MKRELRIKTQGFAVNRWINMTKNFARKQLERHREESMTLQQAHRHQNFVNTLYQCSCFFAQSQSAGFRQYVQENSLGSLLESPQVRSFFKIIKNYLCMQYEFEQCVITMKIPSQSSVMVGGNKQEQSMNKFFMIKFLNNPLMDISCGEGGQRADQDLLFSSRNHSRDQISQLMKDIEISEISHRSGDKSSSTCTRIDLIDPQKDEFIQMHLKCNQKDQNKPKILKKVTNNKRYSNALQVRDIDNMRSIILGPINLKTIVRHPYPILQESKNRDDEQQQYFQELIGSIQLYSSTNQFQNELEIKQFSQLCEAISPCMLSFITAIRNTLNADNFLIPPLKNIRTLGEEDYFVKLHSCTSLSSLSRFFISNPEIFQGASKALLIHLPFYTADQQRMAFFYSFEDCHIYNFQYSASFIDQIILTHLPLTFSESKSLSEQSSSNANTYSYIRYLPILSNSPGGQYIGKNQEFSSVNNGIKNALRSITKSNPNLPSVIAILELCHQPINKEANSKISLHNPPQQISQSQLEISRVTGIHLQGLRSRVKNFVILLTKFDSILKMKSINSKFQKWKRILSAINGQKQAKITKGKMSTIQSQIHQIQGSMVQYSETIQSYQEKINHMQVELNQSYENREKLSKDLDSMKREKRAKLKFLAASLIFGQMQGVICGVMRMKNAFQIWKADSTCMKIAQNAFNKVLQLNHKHAGARFDTAFFLMSRFRKKFNDRMVYFSFRSIAHHQAVVYDCGSKILASHSGVFGAKYQNELNSQQQQQQQSQLQLQLQQQQQQKLGAHDMILTPNKLQRNKGSGERRHLNVNLSQIKPQYNTNSSSIYSTSKQNYRPPSPYLTPNTRKEGGRSAGRKSQTKRSTSGKRIY